MNLRLIGLSHHRSPLELRERISFSKPQVIDLLQKWKQELPESEVVLLSTCNRTEIYLAGGNAEVDDALIIRELAEIAQVPTEELQSYLFQHRDRDAIEHLFRVAASLDSMVLGETQIVTQVRNALELSQEIHTKLSNLNPAFQKAIASAKAIATQTGINRHRTSVASVAISGFATDIFETLQNKRILVVGAGDVAVETLNYLQGYGVNQIHVVNRSLDRATKLAAQFAGESHPWEQLHQQIQLADLVVSATAAEQYILSAGDFQAIHQKRKQRTLLVLDLALPRDFDPAIGDCTNVYLYSVDDLKVQCEQNRRLREQELPKAEKIIDSQVNQFLQEFNLRWTAPTIRMLRDRTQSLKEEELMRLMNKLGDLGPEYRKEIEVAFDRLVNKLLHSPMESLRDEAKQGKPVGLTESLKRLFKLGNDLTE